MLRRMVGMVGVMGNSRRHPKGWWKSNIGLVGSTTVMNLGFERRLSGHDLIGVVMPWSWAQLM